MNSARRQSSSRLLSLVLRHRPEEIGIQLDAAGWVAVDILLAALGRYGHALTREELTELVVTSDKQRFAFNTDQTRFRANHGHSVELELEYAPALPPAWLFHGTAERVLPQILEQGLQRGARLFVHLTADRETARKVGKRHGHPVLLRVAAGTMHQAGHTFYLSGSGVWLTESVPREFIEVETATSTAPEESPRPA